METEKNAINPPANPEMDMVARAEKILAEVKEREQNVTAEREKNEKLVTRMVMGGQSAAGQPQVAPPVETPKDYAKRVMSGRI